MSTVMDLYTKVTKLPQGQRVFSLLFSQKAPYFATVRPRFVELRPNYAELTIRKRTGRPAGTCNSAEVAPFGYLNSQDHWRPSTLMM